MTLAGKWNRCDIGFLWVCVIKPYLIIKKDKEREIKERKRLKNRERKKEIKPILPCKIEWKKLNEIKSMQIQHKVKIKKCGKIKVKYPPQWIS